MSSSAPLPDIKKRFFHWGNSHNLLAFHFLDLPIFRQKQVASPSFGASFRGQMNSFPGKRSAGASEGSGHREQHRLAISQLQGAGVTQAPRLPAAPFAAATSYVNCTPLTFTLRSAGLHFWDEGWKAALAQGTHLPWLYGNETWSWFAAGLWRPRWGNANCGRRARGQRSPGNPAGGGRVHGEPGCPCFSALRSLLCKGVSLLKGLCLVLESIHDNWIINMQTHLIRRPVRPPHRAAWLTEARTDVTALLPAHV